jgi:periplasmic protein TonB
MNTNGSMLPGSGRLLAASFAVSITVHAVILVASGYTRFSPVYFGAATAPSAESGVMLEIVTGEPVTEPAPAMPPVPENKVVVARTPIAENAPLPPEPAKAVPDIAVLAKNSGDAVADIHRDISPAAPVATAAGTTALTAAGGAAADLTSVRARPDYLRNPPPVYPPAARRAGLQGTVLLEACINERGAVAGLRVKNSSGHLILDRAAAKSVGEWRFHPACIGPLPIASTVEIPVRFQLE